MGIFETDCFPVDFATKDSQPLYTALLENQTIGRIYKVNIKQDEMQQGRIRRQKGEIGLHCSQT